MSVRNRSRVAALVALGLASAAPAEPDKGPPNRLAKESSPYLLQHAHNPVDWFPWGPEAFEKARKENKLVFLSIGYSSCHWCHVMERESFSDPALAKALNDHFVCIKVDREERPDVDEVYMTALTVGGNSGGWPLSMFLTPDGKPIFGGTYFPPKDKEVEGGKISGFGSVLKRVNDLNRDKHAEIFAQADRNAEATKDELERAGRTAALVPLERGLVADAIPAFDIDPEWGGLGSKRREYKGAKFPRVAAWSFLLRMSRANGNERLAAQVDLTLRQMALGGIYDHVGGGFHRYGTERTWTVPHFEKMLYDNAQLVGLYTEAFRARPDPLYNRVVAETLAFVAREMTSPEGVFYSALDADSNGKEGEFYVWTLDELKAALGNGGDFEAFRMAYASGPANFEGKSFVLRLAKPVAEAAKDLGTTEPALLARLDGFKAKLLAARGKRVRPFLDTKVVTGWNGQMIAAYAKAGRTFGEKAWTAAAARAADFLLAELRTKEGRLLRTYGARPGEKPAARIDAFLDDYAYLALGLLALHEATGEARWLDGAKALADSMDKWYGDAARGGYFFAAHDRDKLFARSKESYDGAQPSGNGSAALLLVRLARATRDEKYRESARKTLQQFAGVLKANPTGVPSMALALDDFLDGTIAERIEPVPLASVPGGKKISASDQVVTGELKVEPTVGGTQSFAVTLTVVPPYRIYANPIGNELLAEAETRIEVWRAGQKVTAQLAYPKGTAVRDALAGDHAVYAGAVAVRGKAPAGDGPLEVRVTVQACNDRQCLAASTLKLVGK